MAIVTLTTDFGDQDHFVAVMKGVILGIAPKTTIVDVTHQVPAFNITEGAFVVAEAQRYFPKKTIHIAVVDPGVGTARRPILVEANGHYFIGPDNGVLSIVYGRAAKPRIRHITNERYQLPSRSHTFHGRDVFAPVAAHLAKGSITPAKLGPAIEDYLRTAIEKPARTGKRTWAGTVLKVDRFGNLITNFHRDDFPGLDTRPVSMLAGVQTVDVMVRTYAEASPGEAVLVIGSSGYIEVVVNQGSAARALGCAAGSPMELSVW